MTIHCGTETLIVPCAGSCYCHHMAMTFGECDGCCVECGCPKNVTAFKRMKAKEWQPFRIPQEPT